MSKHTSIAEVKAALTKHAGLLSPAAAELGIARQSIHERVVGSPELQAHLHDIEEGLLDEAESVIHEAINEHRDTKTARWYLERKAKRRGYAASLVTERRVTDLQFEAFIAALGKDPETYRQALRALGADPDQALEERRSAHSHA